MLSLNGHLTFLYKKDKRGEVDKEGNLRLEKISDAIKVLLESIGEDVNREGLLKTPERYAKALLFLTKGYTEDLESKRN